MLVVSCPKCRQSYSLPPEKEGLRVRCKCGRQFVAEARAARGGRKKDNSGLVLGLGLGGFVLVVILLLVFSGSGKTPPSEEDAGDEAAKVVRDTSKDGPALQRDGVDAKQVVPVVEPFLGAMLSGGPFEALRPGIAFDFWYEAERRRLAELSQQLPPWASLPAEERKRFESELLARFAEPPGEPEEWTFPGYERMDPQPLVYREHGYPSEELHATAHYRLKLGDTGKGRNVYVDVVFHPTSRTWLVEGFRKRVSVGGSLVYVAFPHPVEARLLASGALAGTRASGSSREVDPGKAFESGLSEQGEYVRTEDGARGTMAKPRAVAHFSETTADERRRMSELLATLSNEDNGLDAARAVTEMIGFKRKAAPPLLTALFENYQKSLEAIEKKDRLAPAHFATEMTILALRRLKEEIYEDVPAEGSTSNVEWSKRAVEGGDLDAAARQLRTVVAFWFGWWSKSEEIQPQGEVQGIGRRRPGGIRR